MTDNTRDEPDRYDRLSPIARALVDDHDACGLAEMLVKTQDELAVLRLVSRGYCPDCGRGDAAPTAADWEQQKQRADEAERQRDAISRMYLTGMSNLGIAANRLDQIRDAARLHRQTLIGTSELHAVIEADHPTIDALTRAHTEATEQRADRLAATLHEVLDTITHRGPVAADPLDVTRWRAVLNSKETP